jgi:glutamate N-acetyltransferase/amino-acid N-acetyltransferase
MQKNMREIDGGICAPKGFAASAVHARFERIEDKTNARYNLALIVSRRYCTAACAFLHGKALGLCAAACKKHLKMQYARAVVMNGEIALMKKLDAYTLDSVCFQVGKGVQVPDEEVMPITCGRMGETPKKDALIDGIKRAFTSLISSRIVTENVAEAIDGESIAFAFSLSDYPCKIGAVFSGKTATTCVLTTDVSISVEMIRKALSTAVKDTFELLQHSGENSPNDTVCILASGEAGNYCIAQEDSEYEKFLAALEMVFDKICAKMAREKGTRRLLTCTVENAKSKRVSRAIVKSIVHSQTIKEELQKGNFPLSGIINAVNGGNELFDLDKIRVSIRSNAGEFLLYEKGSATPYETEVAKKIIGECDVAICIDCKSGNYDSTAYGGF